MGDVRERRKNTDSRKWETESKLEELTEEEKMSHSLTELQNSVQRADIRGVEFSY